MDLDSILGLGRSPGGGHGNPLQYSLPGESPWSEEPGGATVHGVTESDMTERLRTAQHTHKYTHTHTYVYIYSNPAHTDI